MWVAAAPNLLTRRFPLTWIWYAHRHRNFSPRDTIIILFHIRQGVQAVLLRSGVCISLPLSRILGLGASRFRSSSFFLRDSIILLTSTFIQASCRRDHRYRQVLITTADVWVVNATTDAHSQVCLKASLHVCVRWYWRRLELSHLVNSVARYSVSYRTLGLTYTVTNAWSDSHLKFH